MAAGWVSLALTARAADTIEVTKRSPKMELPGAAASSPVGTSRPFDFLRSNSPDGGVVEPLPFPSSTPGNASKKLLELLDQRKNWMFAKPGESKSSLNELFGVRENELEPDGKKPKKSIEKFLGDKENQSLEKGANQSTNSQEGASSTDMDSQFGLRDSRSSRIFGDGGKIDKPRQEFNPLTGRLEAAQPSSLTPAIAGLHPGISSLGGMGSRMADAGAAGMVDLRKEQLRRDERWNQLFDRGGAPDKSPLAGPLDPVNFKTDSTLQPANPIFPTATRSGLPAMANRPATPDVSRLGFVNAPAVARPSVLDGLESRSAGSSLATPAVILPSSAPLAQPKPAVLEFPRRQF